MNKEFFTQNSLKSVFLLLMACFFAISGVNAQASFTGQNFNIPTTGTSGPGFGTCDVACVGTVANGANITLQVTLAHSFMGDINMWLIAPSGQVLELSTRNGGGNNNMNVVFSDAGATFITSAQSQLQLERMCVHQQLLLIMALSGQKAETMLLHLLIPRPSNVPAVGTFTFANTFTGINANGTWTLRGDDGVGGDDGVTCTWSINFAGVSVPTCTFVGGPVLPVLNLSTSVDNCVSDPITVPAVTAVTGACVGPIISYSVDNGMFVTLPCR